MNTQHLTNILKEHTSLLDVQANRWRAEFHGRQVLVAVDEPHDRMRIMAAVMDDVMLEELDLRMLLTANFDRTLDARYALSGGYLWAIYLHPLQQLTERMLVDALHQVVTLADSYGRRYASGNLHFSGGKK